MFDYHYRILEDNIKLFHKDKEPGMVNEHLFWIPEHILSGFYAAFEETFSNMSTGNHIYDSYLQTLLAI